MEQGSVEEMLGDMQVNDVKIEGVFEGQVKYLSVIKEIVELLNNMEDKIEAKSIAEEIAHILGMTAVMCRDMSHHFKRDFAEERWRGLLKFYGLRHDVMNEPPQCPKTVVYSQIYKLLCMLLPEELQFVISAASTMTAYAWRYRRQLAKWIVSNWTGDDGVDVIVRFLLYLARGAYSFISWLFRSEQPVQPRKVTNLPGVSEGEQKQS